MPRALLSVSDKRNLAEFAAELQKCGFELVSTGGTAKALQAAGLPVTPVSDVTRFPEMLDGRVKTLHPAVHGGILARRSRADDLEALTSHGITPIDVVVVNLYPFARAAANPDTRFDALIEEIDIGGPSMVRSAAKNFRDVLVIVDPSDYPAVIDALRSPGGPSAAWRFELARKAFAHTAAYDGMIASTLADITVSDQQFVRPAGAPAPLPTLFAGQWQKLRDLRYGENPHQRAAWYAGEHATGLGAATVLQGKELSFTNLLDLDAAARIVLEFQEPAAAVIKHTNPCGAAVGSSIGEAYVSARDADPLSAFGGIVGLNRAIDAETAKAITATFMEAVIAPAVNDDARAILATKTNLRVVVADFARFSASAPADLEVRSILGAMLVQERDRVLEAQDDWETTPRSDGGLRVVTARQPSAAEWKAMRFAWRVCAHVKSNTILFANADRTLAVGAGQMSRVDAVNVAVMKAGNTLQGSVAASDAFFPFRDGLDAIARAGATAVVQPGGSVRDKDVIAAADEHGLVMVFTGRRHFRH
jgi:phosphoribosylaminoimidazolecarboxamide formyltransferase/IMP cyclohydrolase